MSRKAALLRLVLCICSLVPSLVAEAQQPTRVYRIGWLSPHVATATVAGSVPNSFVRELRNLGYVEGRNLEFVVRLAELVINKRTAKALGITIPQSLLLLANEVIQ